MGFGQAISAGFSNYVNFRDRASRSEYWYWVLFTVAVEFVGVAIGKLTDITAINVVYGIFVLVTILPTFAVTIRRLHDLDRSGWWIFLSFVPLVGAIILLIWFCTKGTSGPNRFGPGSLAMEAMSTAPRPV